MSNEIALNGKSSREIARRNDNAPRQISGEARLLRGAFRVAGLAAGAAVRGGQWATGSTVEVGRQIVTAAIEGESSAELAERASAGVRSIARSALGVTEGSVREVVSYVPSGHSADGSVGRRLSRDDLRHKGDALLALSADVNMDDDVHPAYARILDEIAPDEARMLRFLALNGPQPSVDIRTNRPLGIGSELILGALASVAEQAGCRYPDRSRSYLMNLARLGLLIISDDPVELSRYMILEVQPNVEAAMRKAGRVPKVVRKSIRLSEFGTEFCEVCFTLSSSRYSLPEN